MRRRGPHQAADPALDVADVLVKVPLEEEEPDELERPAPDGDLAEDALGDRVEVPGLQGAYAERHRPERGGGAGEVRGGREAL